MTIAARFIQRLLRVCLLGGLFASAATVALAQPAGTEGADPPGRVARLADLSGGVWLQNPDSGEWVGAWRNQPLTSGDRLATDANGRAELRIGSTVLRLDGGGELEVLRLDDERITVQLHNGSLALRVRANEAVRELEVQTSDGRFVPTRTGRYRIDRRGNGGSTLTVYGGEARYEGPGSALTVYSNQRADFRLDGTGQAQYAIVEPVRDDFAAWTADRDRADDRADAERQRSVAGRYVSPEMTGIEDLDRNGVWEQDAEYGALWIPRAVPVGWAPYAAGRWAWVRPWGWTWVDDAPWGFAPFHYGRWVSRRNVWCWAPGSYVARPVYAPALVGWVGGPGLNVSVNIGGGGAGGGRGPSVGWFPLAPREVFVPGYRVSPRYVREVNVTHVTNITNVTTIVNNPQGAVAGIDYRNRHFPNALTMVPQSVLSQHQPVAPAALPWRGERGDRSDNRGDRGDRGRPEPVAADVVVAPPPLVRPGGNGARAEPGRPAWPRGGMQRPDAPLPARNAAAPALPQAQQPMPPQQQMTPPQLQPQTQPQAPLPQQAQPQRPFTREPQPAVSATPAAPVAAPREPRAEERRFDRTDDRRNERSDDRRDDRRDGRRDERRESEMPRRDDRRAMPAPAAPVAAPVQMPAPPAPQPVRVAPPNVPQPQPAPRVEAPAPQPQPQPQRQAAPSEERRSFERPGRERERER